MLEQSVASFYEAGMLLSDRLSLLFNAGRLFELSALCLVFFSFNVTICFF
jgi:hypothetical protein